MLGSLDRIASLWTRAISATCKKTRAAASNGLGIEVAIKMVYHGSDANGRHARGAAGILSGDQIFEINGGVD